MSVLGGMCIGEVNVLDRTCVYQREICSREMSVLERCLDWGDVCIREVSVLERCVY